MKQQHSHQTPEKFHNSSLASLTRKCKMKNHGELKNWQTSAQVFVKAQLSFDSIPYCRIKFAKGNSRKHFEE